MRGRDRSRLDEAHLTEGQVKPRKRRPRPKRPLHDRGVASGKQIEGIAHAVGERSVGL